MDPNRNFDIARAETLKSIFFQTTSAADYCPWLPPLLAPTTGNHPFCVMQESMSLVYSFFKDLPLHKSVKHERIFDSPFLCSFWDLLPDQIKEFSDRTMIRSESFALRYCGNDLLGDEAGYLNFLPGLISKQPARLIYRLLDYCEEFAFLNTELDREVRGAERILEDYDNSTGYGKGYLLEREIKVINLILNSGRSITVLVPFCIDVDHYHAIYNTISERFKSHPFQHNLSLGVSIENLYSLKRLEEFTAAETMFFAASDLKASIDREEGLDVQRSNVDVTVGKAKVAEYVNRHVNLALDRGLNKDTEFLPCKALIGSLDKVRERGPKARNIFTPDQVVLPLEVREKIEAACKQGITLTEDVCEWLKGLAEEAIGVTAQASRLHV